MINQTILQFLLRDPSIPLDEFKDLVGRLRGADTSEADVNHIIQLINRSIESLHFKIVKSSCEVTGNRMINLIVTAETQGAKGSLPKKEKDYFHALLDTIVKSGGSFAVNAAHNLGPQFELTVSEAETVIESFVTKRLLVLQFGHLFLSSFAVAEFHGFISNNYDVGECAFCHDIVVYGSECKNCEIAFHFTCQKNFLEASKKKARCPQCKAEWTETASQIP